MPRRRLPAWMPDGGLELSENIDGTLGLVIAGIVLLPVTILLAVFLFEWLLVLLLLPLATFASAFIGRPWLIVARQGSGFPARYVSRAERHRYATLVRGWGESALTIAQARREIAETGAPESLGPPGPLRPPRQARLRHVLPSER